MSSAAIVSTLPQQKIQIIQEGRKIDFEGFDVDVDDEKAYFMGGIVPLGFKEKKTDQDGSLAVDDNNIYACGQIDIQLDDKVILPCSNTAKVLKAVYWQQGDFTHIITRTLTRKETSYVESD